MAEYVITERRERLGADNNKHFELLLTPATKEPQFARRVMLAQEDWQTFGSGDLVGYDSGRLWHKELPDMPVQVQED